MAEPKTVAALTPRQRAFVAEFLLDRNATQAALRAGYSPNGVRVTASRLLANANIQGFIANAETKRSIRTQITQDDVIRMLEREATAGDLGVPNSARIKAQELIGKHYGMFTDKVQVEQTGPPPTINVRFGKPAAADETQQE